MRTTTQLIRLLFERVVVFLFLAALVLPAIVMIATPPQEWSENENRSLARWPALPTSIAALTQYFQGIDDYLGDHFGFRNLFIARYQRELEKHFDRTPDHYKVVKGVGDWFFYSNFGLLEDFRGETPLTDDQLDSWLAKQRERTGWLAARNIRYYLAVAPNKQSIYPELLMRYAMAVKGTSRYEQLEARLVDDPLAPLIDLHGPLKAAKGGKNLYYRHDSHWNKLGAYIGFQTIFARIAADFPEVEFRTEFAFAEDQYGIGGNLLQGGDLARILMKRTELKETYPVLAKFDSCSERHSLEEFALSDINTHRGRRSFMTTCDSAELTAVIFRDSFFVPLEHLVAENFKRAIFLWKDYDQTNMEEILHYFKPDIVLEVRVERHLFDDVAPRTPDEWE